MPNEENANIPEEENEEEQEEKEKKSFLSRTSVKILAYISVFLLLVLVSIVTAIIVYDLKASSKIMIFDQRVYIPEAAPRDVYRVPEFKLALDKKDEESITTIVQVELVLAYEKENQQILTEIIQRKDQIRDKVQYVIAKKTYEEINTAIAREEILKKDLLNALNGIMHGQILDIYFNTFVISRLSS